MVLPSRAKCLRWVWGSVTKFDELVRIEQKAWCEREWWCAGFGCGEDDGFRAECVVRGDAYLKPSLSRKY